MTAFENIYLSSNVLRAFSVTTDVDVMPRDLFVQGLARDPQQIAGERYLATGLLKRLDQQHALERGDPVAQAALRQPIARWNPGQIEHGVVSVAAQLASVPRPIVFEQSAPICCAHFEALAPGLVERFANEI